MIKIISDGVKCYEKETKQNEVMLPKGGVWWGRHHFWLETEISELFNPCGLRHFVHCFGFPKSKIW